jgi:holo-[acyl-carrier protein] synthase
VGDIAGMGIDLVDVARFERLLAEWPRMGPRLFTDAERAYAGARHRPGQHLAARFAAKEAAFKALGAGWPEIAWHDVEVVATSGPPRLELRGRAAERAAGARALVSLAHDGGMAVAQVLLVRDAGAGR